MTPTVDAIVSSVKGTIPATTMPAMTASVKVVCEDGHASAARMGKRKKTYLYIQSEPEIIIIHD